MYHKMYQTKISLILFLQIGLLQCTEEKNNINIKIITYEMTIILTIIENDRRINGDKPELFDRYVNINKHIFSAIRERSVLMCDFLWGIANIENLFNEYDSIIRRYIPITNTKRYKIINELFEINEVWDIIDKQSASADKDVDNKKLFDEYYYSIIPTASIEVIAFWSIFTHRYNVMHLEKIDNAKKIASKYQRINVLRFLNLLKPTKIPFLHT